MLHTLGDVQHTLNSLELSASRWWWWLSLTNSLTPPVKSTRASAVCPPLITWYEPANLVRLLTQFLYTISVSYLAYAFSSRDAQNSLVSCDFMNTSSFWFGPVFQTGRLSSITTSIHSPNRQNWKWNTPQCSSGWVWSQSCQNDITIVKYSTLLSRSHLFLVVWNYFRP